MKTESQMTQQEKDELWHWIEALQSGKYEQKQDGWYGSGGEMCCLSVAVHCGLAKVPDQVNEPQIEDRLDDIELFGGLSRGDIYTLMYLNDDDGFDFEMIAEALIKASQSNGKLPEAANDILALKEEEYSIEDAELDDGMNEEADAAREVFND
jgi:hypothetical protein